MMMNNEWAQAVDPVSGRVYYFNKSTGATSWTPPAVHFPPPPIHFPPPPPLPSQHGATVIGHAAAHDTIPPTVPLQQQQQQIHPLTAPHNTNNAAPSVTYQLDSSTATTPGLLVPSVRAIIEKEQTQKSSIRKIELEGVSAGTVADLCNVSIEFRSRNLNIDGGDFAQQKTSTPHGEPNSNANDEAANHYYMPLQPFSLPLQSRPPHVEPGRVDIRLHALYKKLRSLADENTT